MGAVETKAGVGEIEVGTGKVRVGAVEVGACTVNVGTVPGTQRCRHLRRLAWIRPPCPSWPFLLFGDVVGPGFCGASATEGASISWLQAEWCDGGGLLDMERARRVW